MGCRCGRRSALRQREDADVFACDRAVIHLRRMQQAEQQRLQEERDDDRQMRWRLYTWRVRTLAHLDNVAGEFQGEED